MNFQKKIKYNLRSESHLPKSVLYTFVVISFMALGFVIKTGPLVYADTRAYFGMWPYVSAGYPFFLRSLHYFFGSNYTLAAVVIQYILVLTSIFCFLKFFLTRFSFKKYQLLLLLVLLCYPVFDNNVLAITNVTTEGVCYALFLQIIHVCYVLFVLRKLKYYPLLLILTVLLITIRGQFVFLTPLFLLIETLLRYKEKKFSPKIIVCIILIPVCTFAIDNVYHKVIQKQYFSTPFTWTALASAVMFVSDEADEQYLTTTEQKEVFNTIHKHFRQKGIGYKDHKYHEEPIDYNYYFFHYEFPTICNQTVQREVVKYYEAKEIPTIQSYLEAERINKQLFLHLLPVNFSKWFSLVFQSFKTGLGGVFIALIYGVLIILFVYSFINTANKQLLFYAFLLLLIVMNRVVVSISVHGLTRYFFYTSWVPLLLVFIGINLFEKKKPQIM